MLIMMDTNVTPLLQPFSAQYVRDRRWLDAHMDELVTEHPDKWVAIVNEQVAAVGDDMGKAFKQA